MKNINEEYRKYEELRRLMPESFLNNNCDYEIETNFQIIQDFILNNKKNIGVIYESDYMYLVVDLIKCSGEYFVYERVIQKKADSAVVIMPIVENNIVLLNQYRHALRSMQYAFPRGFGEYNLTPEENAIKELTEETGATIIDITYLGQVVADSGIIGSKVSIFVAKISDFIPNNNHEGIERVFSISMDKFEEMIANNEITDAFTLSAYSMYNQIKIKSN